jgi:hypothetical protein
MASICGATLMLRLNLSRVTVFAALALFAAGPGLHGMAADAAGPIALSNELLDHWVQVLRDIGAASLAEAAPDKPAAPLPIADPARLDRICSTAGFASPEECGCTVLYAAILMQGFDKNTKQFIDPARAIANRISASLKTIDMPPEKKEVSLAGDRRLYQAVRKALPNGAPAEHLTLITAYLRDHMQLEAQGWKEFGAGMRALDTALIGDRCTKLPSLTQPAG